MAPGQIIFPDVVNDKKTDSSSDSSSDEEEELSQPSTSKQSTKTNNVSISNSTSWRKKIVPAGDGGGKEQEPVEETKFSPYFPLPSESYSSGKSRPRTGSKTAAFDDVVQKNNDPVKQKAEEIMKTKSVFKPGFEKQLTVQPVQESRKQLKKQRRIEREKTKGKEWFDLPATEMTEERKRDLEILHMRDTLDPKRFYKSNDRNVLPKYFQVGTVVDQPIDFYHSRIPKKQRKQTLVDELLSDADFQKYNKRKYDEIEERHQKARKGAFRNKGYPKKKNRKTEQQ